MIYRTKLITNWKFHNMKIGIIAIFAALLIIPVNSSFSQEFSDTGSTLGIELTNFSPYHYKDDEGHTVIVGWVENKKNFPVTGIKIWAGFYDSINEQPLESTVGTSLLKVIPPFERSPYMIRSPSPNSAITDISVNLLGFNSAAPKGNELAIDAQYSASGDSINISGTLTNSGTFAAEEIEVHIGFSDAFEPPRMLKIVTIKVPEVLEPGSTIEFEIDEPFDQRVHGFSAIAESSHSYSNILNEELTSPDLASRLITISDVTINDNEGNKLTDIIVGTPVSIQSKTWIQYATQQENYEQPYVYYAQVKHSERIDGETKTFVDFLGYYEGVTDGGTQFPAVEWTPEKGNLYFIETYVWDPNAIPLADKGPVFVVNVN